MAKSPTRRSCCTNTPFTNDQEIWIVKRSAFMAPVTSGLHQRIRRVERISKESPTEMPFNVSSRDSMRRAAQPVDQRNQMKPSSRPRTLRGSSSFFPTIQSHTRDAVVEFETSYSSIWRILRLRLKWKAYKPICVNKLTEMNKQDRVESSRVEFCRWFLVQPEDFAQRILWSDE